VIGAEHAPLHLARERDRDAGVFRNFPRQRACGGGCTALTSRAAKASPAGKTRPVNIHSSACEIPTMRGRNQLEQASGTIPRRTNTKPNRASADASRMSIGSSIVAPTPTAEPFTAAITGLRQEKMRSVTRPPPSRAASLVRSG